MQPVGGHVADEIVFLLGRPPLQEYIAFVKIQTVDGQTIDAGPLADEWRTANDHIASLEVSEAGLTHIAHPRTMARTAIRLLGLRTFRAPPVRTPAHLLWEQPAAPR